MANRAELRLLAETPIGLSHSSIHKAKGQEFEAVMFVIPPDDRYSRSEELLENWRGRRMEEPNRVAYVALTRAKRLLSIAVPRQLTTKLEEVFGTAKVPFERVVVAKT